MQPVFGIAPTGYRMLAGRAFCRFRRGLIPIANRAAGPISLIGVRPADRSAAGCAYALVTVLILRSPGVSGMIPAGTRSALFVAAGTARAVCSVGVVGAFVQFHIARHPFAGLPMFICRLFPRSIHIHLMLIVGGNVTITTFGTGAIAARSIMRPGTAVPSHGTVGDAARNIVLINLAVFHIIGQFVPPVPGSSGVTGAGGTTTVFPFSSATVPEPSVFFTVPSPVTVTSTFDLTVATVAVRSV